MYAARANIGQAWIVENEDISCFMRHEKAMLQQELCRLQGLWRQGNNDMRRVDGQGKRV
jgi:hypothetical protein